MNGRVIKGPTKAQKIIIESLSETCLMYIVLANSKMNAENPMMKYLNINHLILRICFSISITPNIQIPNKIPNIPPIISSPIVIQLNRLNLFRVHLKIHKVLQKLYQQLRKHLSF